MSETSPCSLLGCSTKSSGMGIGLYLTKRIVEAHGGTIEARSPEGGGTEFRIELPGA